jgi:phosphoribosylaminoimidazole carboxylase PurE protein
MKFAVFMGSASDLDVAEGAVAILKEFEVPFTLEVTSAHRSPGRTMELIRSCEGRGCRIFIAMAGKAAHLAGVVAAHTLLPVIGVPVGGSSLAGMDSLFSTVQMPQGIPVACMGIGKSGAANAALLAVQILSLSDEDLKARFESYRMAMPEQVRLSSEAVKERL